jgi:hypothetical protein
MTIRKFQQSLGEKYADKFLLSLSTPNIHVNLSVCVCVYFRGIYFTFILSVDASKPSIKVETF